ncbi:MAG TPA: hypothetical protein EYP62_07100 [Kiritimatiellae bacterium]|nr:hypothetical protein [Kiritimatiellia bacterium]
MRQARPASGQHRAAALSGLLVFLWCGCVSEQIVSDRAVRTTLTTTRVGNRVVIAWESRPEVYYTVVFAPARSPGGVWRPLRGCVRLPGTGGMIVVTNYVPQGMEYRYRLIVEPRGGAGLDQ